MTGDAQTAQSVITARLQIPKAFRELFEPKRYKVYHGGRGGAKSHAIANALLILGTKRKLRILCARELQVSIADSVHKLLADIITEHKLDAFYTITQHGIKGANGTEFIFKGLRHNVREIKGLEAIDIAWAEEAQIISDNSWELLIPSIRKDGSEIWMSFNPKNPTDPTWQRFVMNADDDMIVRKVSYRDNPFFPAVLEKERRKLERSDPEAYLHIWEGEFDTRFNGAVYARFIEPGRVKPELYDHTLPVFTSWDLGFDDATAIWWWQVAGKEVRWIDYYEASGEDIGHYASVVLGRGVTREVDGVDTFLPYTYEALGHYAPHDAANKLLAAGGRSIVQQAHALGVKMRVVSATSQQNGIEALRAVLKNSWFDRDRCKDGVAALMHYHFEYDEDKAAFKSKPLHDWSSHGSDAAEIVGQVMRKPVESKPIEKPRFFEQATANEIFWGDIDKPKSSYKRI